MPYGTPYTDSQRITRHQSLYGNSDIPSIRKRNINIQSTENTGAYLIGGIIVSGIILYLLAKK